VLRATDRNAEAVPLFEQAHAILLQALGEDHPHTQFVAKKLAATETQD
jgi:hypothetical protein